MIDQPAQSDSPAQKKFPVFVSLTFTAVCLVFVAVGVIQRKTGQHILPSVSVGQSNTTSTIAQKLLPQPTPFPFEDMTVPYLRNRTYSSTLGELEQIGTSGAYTSYIAKYDSDGLSLRGLLTKPTGDMPEGGWPAIIFIHGYIAPTIYKTTSNYVSYANQFADDGFVVFKIDLRGHDQSEGDPGGAYYSADYIIDTLNAYAALQGSGFVNPDKIGLWGHSMAGNVVMRTLVAKPEIPAAVIWAGAGYTYDDLLKYGIADNSYRPPQQNTERQRKRNEMRELYGDYDPTNWFWKLVTPANYLSDLKGAIQVHHADDDAVVSVNYARDLMTLLDKTSVKHEFHEYQTGGHNLTGASFTQAMQLGTEFFKEHLK